MSFRVEITDRAQLNIDEFARHCRDYSADFWNEQEARLAYIFEVRLASTPHTWTFFFVTGAPYRAFPYEVGVRTKLWIVYTIDEERKTVNVLRVWNTARDPDEFGV
jgi:plasmid stabilization system protein ParE